MAQETTRAELHELHKQLRSYRHEAGIRTVYDWLKYEREQLNRRWPALAGDELLQAQGQAKALDRLKQMMETDPVVTG